MFFSALSPFLSHGWRGVFWRFNKPHETLRHPEAAKATMPFNAFKFHARELFIELIRSCCALFHGAIRLQNLHFVRVLESLDLVTLASLNIQEVQCS
mmetsp:Transcript_78534/g.143051  ORF Transcript_78534/g.143051 Transcript_78534/m.143051 type:complete len:97 (+) Transcript_78534:2-292(+)